MSGLLILISMVTGTVSFISLIRPLPGLWLPTRKRAGVVWVASFVPLFIGAVPPPNPAPEKLENLKAQAQERLIAAINNTQGAERKAKLQQLILLNPDTKEFPQEISQILLARVAARKAEEQQRAEQRAEAENFLSNGVGKKVPYELWVNGIFGAPDTLDGTDGRYWVAHLAEIDVSFISEKSSKEVLYVGHGKSAQDYLEKKEVARKERLEKGFSSLWDGSHRELTKVIKGSMNDPGSYEQVETVYWDMGDHLVVRTTFRGKNAFGGVVSNWVKAKADLDGNVLEVIEQGQ